MRARFGLDQLRGDAQAGAALSHAAQVHPPLSHSRPTERLPSHSSLRFVRQRRPRAKHCPSAPVARDGRAGPFRPRRRQRSGRRPTRPFASMPVLWWPHDRSREVSTRRRSAPRFAKPDQDRLVMIENNLPATSQRRAPPSLAVRQREQYSLNGVLRLPQPRQKHAIPNPEAAKRPASRRPNPANPQSIFASNLRRPHTPIPKSP